MILDKYPRTDLHELNLDWLLKKVAELEKEVGEVGDIDDKIKELEEAIANLDILLSESLGKDLVDESLYNLFGQVIPNTANRFDNTFTAQGFCIGTNNGRPISMQCFYNTTDPNPDNNISLIVFTYMDDGSEIGRIVGYFGHSNSCCYNKTKDKYYIASSGGSNTTKFIQEISIDGTIGAQFLLENNKCWAITWNKDIFYCLASDPNDVYCYLYKCDNDFNIIDKIDITDQINNCFVYQGLCSDDNYLYLFNGNTITGNSVYENINRCTVMNHNGKNIKQVLMTYPLEIEEGDFFDGQMVIASNTTHIALHVLCDMYLHNRHCSFGKTYDNIDLNHTLIEIYVDEDYQGYYSNGTSGGPLSAMTLLILWLRNSTDRLNIKILNDIRVDDHPSLSFRRVPNTIFDIDGHNHKLPNLLLESGEVYINNAFFPGINNKDTIDFYGDRIVIKNCKFGSDPDLTDPLNPVYDSTTPSRIITITSNYEIDGVTINQNTTANGVLFYFLGTGYLRTVNIVYPRYNYFALLGTCIVDSTFPLNNLRNQYRQTYKPGFSLTSSATVDFTKLKFPCRFLRSGATITNLPAGETSSDIFLIDVELSGSVNTIVTIHHNDHTESIYYN